MIPTWPEILRRRNKRLRRQGFPKHGYRIEELEARRMLSAPAQWYTSGIGGGGALYTPALSPFNTSEVWLATDMSELFHTTNMGASWTYPNFNQIQGDPSVDVQYTSNPQILYSINSLYEYPSGGPDHLSQSTDGGNTWTNVPGWNLGTQAYNLYANPSSTTELIASDGTNLYLSSNGGTTFSIKYTAATAGTLYCAGAYFNGSNIFVGTNLGLLESTNNGSTFSVASVSGIPSGQGMLSFAGSTSGSTTRFFCVTVPSTDLGPGLSNYSVANDYSGIYSLTLGQSSWASASTGIGAGQYPDFISMTNGDVSDVYAAGTDSNGHPSVYKSTNAGTGWTGDFTTVDNVNINTAWEGQGGDNNWGFGGCAFGLEVSPVNANIVVMSDEDGVYYTTNGGTTWTQMFVKPSDSNPAGQNTPKHKVYHGVGINQTSVWDVTWSSATNMFASYTDLTGTHSTDGGIGWSFPNYGSVLQNTIYQTVVGPTGILYAADSSIHDLFQSDRLTSSIIDAGTGAVIMSTDGGADWTMLHNFGHPVDDIILDPNVANRAYALVVNSTAGGIFVTNDLNDGASSTWTQLTNPPRTAGHPWDMQILTNGTLLVTYSGTLNPSTDKFSDTSGIFTSTNGGSSWTDVSTANMDYYTKDVIVAPWDSTQKTWYVTVDNAWGGNGNNKGGIYETTNGGQSWTWVFSEDGVDSLTINPTTDEMYIATVTTGLWYSADADLATPTFSELADYPFHQPEGIFIDPYNSNEIWVTSFGGGLMVGYTTAPSVASRDLFYAGSSFDGNEPAPNADDANAIATDKTALLPGNTATYANFTSYAYGIDGIIVDLADGPPTQLALSDFSFAVGTSSTPSSWAAAPAPTSMTVLPGGGVNDSERVEFVWANNAIQNEWLQVTVDADSDTGLSNPDVFYYANMMGATGATTLTNQNGTYLRVGPADVTGTELAVGPAGVPITSLYDFNRDGRVTPADVSFVQEQVGPAGLLFLSAPAAAGSSMQLMSSPTVVVPKATPTVATPAAAATVATPADPPVKVAAAVDPPAKVAAAVDPPVKVTAATDPPIKVAASSDPPLKIAAPFLFALPGRITAFVPVETSPWLQSLSGVLGPLRQFRILV
jgi:hypothetical protein